MHAGKINQTETFLVKSKNVPPKTCCEQIFFNNISDYILYSNNLNPIIDNNIYYQEFTKQNNISDHFPVYVELVPIILPTSTTTSSIASTTSSATVSGSTLVSGLPSLNKINILLQQYLNIESTQVSVDKLNKLSSLCKQYLNMP